jgi:hypothetical protein
LHDSSAARKPARSVMHAYGTVLLSASVLAQRRVVDKRQASSFSRSEAGFPSLAHGPAAIDLDGLAVERFQADRHDLIPVLFGDLAQWLGRLMPASLTKMSILRLASRERAG